MQHISFVGLICPIPTALAASMMTRPSGCQAIASLNGATRARRASRSSAAGRPMHGNQAVGGSLAAPSAIGTSTPSASGNAVRTHRDRCRRWLRSSIP